MDPERARNGPYGGTIAHGFWTLSGALFILRNGGDGIQVQLPTRMGLNYGLNRVGFISPVRVGKRIRAHARLLSVDEIEPNVFQQVNEDHGRNRRRGQAPVDVARRVSAVFWLQPLGRRGQS